MFTFFDDYNTPSVPSWLVANNHIYVIEAPENTGMQDYKVFLNRIVSVSEADRTFTYRFDTGFPTFTASVNAERSIRFNTALEQVEKVYSDYCSDKDTTREQTYEFFDFVRNMIQFAEVLKNEAKD